MSGLVQDLIDAGCAIDDIERLLQQWGGLPLYVPHQIGPDHIIHRVAGAKVAAVLCRLLGGERPTLPLGVSLRRERSRKQVAELRAAGLNHAEIARRLGLHLRQVQRLVVAAREADGDARQPARRDDRQLSMDL